MLPAVWAWWASFDLRVQNDGKADGPQPVTISASAEGLEPDSHGLWVEDAQEGELFLALPEVAAKGTGINGLTGSVFIRKALDFDLIVYLLNDSYGWINHPQAVVIQAGSTSAVFSFSIDDSNSYQSDRTYHIMAQVRGWRPVTREIIVRDFTPRILSLEVPETIEEGESLWCEINLPAQITSTLAIDLSSDNPFELRAPAAVTITRQWSGAGFRIEAMEDHALDGDHMVTLTASAPGWESASATVTVVDPDPKWEMVDMSGLGLPEGYDFNAVWGTGMDNVYIGGEGGTLLHFNGVEWTRVITSTAEYKGIWGSSADDIHAVGTCAGGTESSLDRPAYFDGHSWALAPEGGGDSDLTFNGVWGTGPDNAYGVGNGGLIAHWDGTQWTELSKVTDYYLGAIWGSGEDDIYAVGSHGTVLHFDGIEWKVLTGARNTFLTAVWGFSPQDIIITGDEYIIYYDGQQFYNRYIDYYFYAYDIWGSAPDKVYVASSRGIQQCEGASCEQLEAPGKGSFYSIWGTLLGGMYAVGPNGKVMRTTERSHGISFLDSVNENDGLKEHFARVCFMAPMAQDSIITLWADLPGQIEIPETLTIPAGEKCAVFDVNVLDNAILDGTRHVTIFASTPGHPQEHGVLTIHDSEFAVLSMEIPQSVQENVGVLQGKVRIDGIAGADVTVRLSTDSNDIRIPEEVVILAGTDEVVFDLEVVDNQNLDQVRTPVITAQVTKWTTGQASLEIVDDEVQQLKLTIPDCTEGDDTVTGTINIPGNHPSGFYVYLESDDESELAVPTRVYMGSYENQVTFDATVMQDFLEDGPISVTVSATADGWMPGSASISVFDDDPWPLTVTMPPSCKEGEFMFTTTLSLPDKVHTRLDVQLSCNDESELFVWDGVYFEPNKSTVRFYTFPVDDTLIDGPIRVTVTASAQGLISGSDTIVVQDNDANDTRSYLYGTGIDYNDIWGSSRKDVVAVGDGGKIAYYNGSKWRGYDIGSLDLKSVWAYGTVYIADDTQLRKCGSPFFSSGKLYPLQGMKSLWGRGCLDVYTLAGDNELWHFNGQYFVNLLMMDPPGVSLVAISGYGDSPIYAVGSNGYVKRQNGLLWETVGHFPEYSFRDLWVGPGETIIAVGPKNTIMHFDGNRWEEKSSGAPHHLNSVYGVDENYAAAVGENGTLLVYQDGVWTKKDMGSTKTFNGVYMTPESEIFIAGNDGYVCSSLPMLDMDYALIPSKGTTEFVGRITYTLPYHRPQDFIVTLTSSDPLLASVPETLTIQAGQASASVDVVFSHEVNACDFPLPAITATTSTTTERSIEVYSSCCPGDLNGDRRLDFFDAMEALNAMVDGDTDCSNTACGDVDGDGRTGPAEVLYILNKMAEE